MKREGNSEFFEELKSAFEDCAKWARGELTLKTTVVYSTPRELKAKDILRMRRRLKMSQGVFAKVVNVSTKTVQSWEQGERKPSHASLRLLQVISEEPQLVCKIAGVRNGKQPSAAASSDKTAHR